MQFLVAQVIAVCTLFGMVDPKTIHAYEEVGVGYVHTIMPAARVLTREELDRSMALLVASDDQVHVINALYVTYVTDRHNAFLDAEMPGYLAKASAIASQMELYGMQSSEYREASLEAERLATRLVHMVEQLELEFVDSIESILAPEQIDALQVLRWQTLRRNSSSLSRHHRWLGLELRVVCDVLPETVLTNDDIQTIQVRLMPYEDELTLLLRHWTSARLEAGRRVRRHLYDVARGAVEPAQVYVAQAYKRPAGIAQRIRLLQMRTLEDLLSALSSDAADLLSTRAKERIFPELYPDSLHTAVTDMLSGVINDAEVSADVRGIATVSLKFYRQEYADICRRIEAFCIEWDDGMHLGTGEYHRNDFPHFLAPLLEERAQISKETMRRFAEEREYRERLR